MQRSCMPFTQYTLTINVLHNYGTFKTAVADLVVEELMKIQNKYNEILNSKELDEILNRGKERTCELAVKKIEEVKEKIGFYK